MKDSQAIIFENKHIIDVLFKFVNSNAQSSGLLVACSISGNVRIMKALMEIGLLTEVCPELTIIMEEVCFYGHLGVVEYTLEDLLGVKIASVAGETGTYLLNAVKDLCKTKSMVAFSSNPSIWHPTALAFSSLQVTGANCGFSLFGLV